VLGIDPADVLLTVAEVSIAFAGFASLIAIFGMRSVSATQTFDLLRYWVMLEFSLAALAFSLLPIILVFVGVSESIVWPGLSGLLAVFVIVHNVVLARLFFRGENTVRSAATPGNMVAANLVYAIIGISQIGNALGFLERQPGWFMFGLFFVLVVAAAHFVLFIGHAIAHLKHT
jgi:hypothetical protein